MQFSLMVIMGKVRDEWTIEEAAHLLNRAGFGGTPEEIDRLHARGRESGVEWLLEAKGSERVEPPGFLGEGRDLMEQLGRLRRGGRDMTPEEQDKKRRELNQALNKLRRENGLTLLGWWMGRMMTTAAPLPEKMVMFWHDHFATSTRKVRNPDFMYQQNALFREYALGNFGELSKKITVDPAMMIYLDAAQSNKKKPNENFARELMELFMLGEGNYTEADVKEAARAFTGYRLNRLTGEVIHARRRWDEGEKEVLGERGAFDAEGIVELLLKNPECGRFLAKKVFAYFCHENPSRPTVERLGRGFAAGNYEVKPLLREIFLSEEFYSDLAMRTRIKSPVEFVVMMVRQLELEPLPGGVLFRILEQLGQVPFVPPNVAGWDWGKAWVNTNTLLTRYHVAGLLTGAGGDVSTMVGKKGGQFLSRALRSRVSKPDYETLAPREIREDVSELVKVLGFRFFQTELREKDRVAFESYARAKKGVVFTNTEVGELIHLMMSTPSYQLT